MVPKKEVKSFDQVELTAQPEGRFTALISTFNVQDKRGDIVRPSAFTDSIKRWQASGDPIPVYYSHQTRDPAMQIGQVDPADLRVTATGLVASGQIDLADPNGSKVFKQLKARTLKEWSYTYLVKRAKTLANGVRELLDVDLVELGPCLVGVGTTATLDVKSATTDRRQELIRVQLAPYRQRLDLAQRRIALARAGR